MTRVTGFILRDGDAHAMYFASCYHHDGHEVWIDAVFSPTWGVADDRTTFGCRVGAVEDSDQPAATMVDAAAPWDETPMFGRKLSRDEALAHPLCGQFWDVVDHVLLNDSSVALHMGYR